MYNYCRDWRRIVSDKQIEGFTSENAIRIQRPEWLIFKRRFEMWSNQQSFSLDWIEQLHHERDLDEKWLMVEYCMCWIYMVCMWTKWIWAEKVHSHSYWLKKVYSHIFKHMISLYIWIDALYLSVRNNMTEQNHLERKREYHPRRRWSSSSMTGWEWVVSTWESKKSRHLGCGIEG
jgi:hypothetical protein